jgi:hypothetical protein
MKKIDITKPIQTVSAGTPVTIISDQGRGKHPLIGYVGTSTSVNVWDEYGFGAFRIKNVKEKKMVPLESSDLKFGDLIKNPTSNYAHSWIAILAVGDAGIQTYYSYIKFEELRKYLISRDGGKTWQKAEKELTEDEDEL